ncbi:MAG: metallopeptidase family protein [Actinomycetaceae bacterium]|nr:metallopeptidase family protein [Actinomycetaceae bacterium]
MPVEMGLEAFEELVDSALEQIPDELLAMVDNVAIIVEDNPPHDMPADLLGLYDGIPLTERAEYFGYLPDRIFIYRQPILGICESEDEVAHEVAVTVIHEIAHHFGIEDEQLHQWGWG